MLNNEHTRITLELAPLSTEEAANLVGVLEELIYQIVRQHSPRIDDYLAGPDEPDTPRIDDDDPPSDFTHSTPIPETSSTSGDPRYHIPTHRV